MNATNEIKGQDKIVDITKVKPNTWNPKDTIEENKEVKRIYEDIKEQIRKKGLFEAITVRNLGQGSRKSWEILDGYHRWRACKELGFEEIRVNDLGKIDDKLARAITVVKEQKKVPVSELGIVDIVGWFREEGVGEDMVQDLLGYDQETYMGYVDFFSTKDLDNDLIGEKEEGGAIIEKKIICPDCGHKFSL